MIRPATSSILVSSLCVFLPVHVAAHAHEMAVGTNVWLSWALGSAVFAALTTILTKLGLDGVDPDLTNLLRTAVIFAAMVLFSLASVPSKDINPWELSNRSAVMILLSGLTSCASWICYTHALKLGDVSKVAPIDKLSLVLATVLATVFLHERPSAREWLGIILIGTGVIVLTLKR